ncbi:ImmA/IrrE family metallo-endopeptidase [Variovorax atrisoli]|uniref:ImmA/IrrE family metallo-endopeptidase n=1 Tax=Variovorax atrisoli TaxID=3394203 RepID=UPI00036FD9F6|nr:ImmA/IrrE family metallo-endopeptidase [Variovorax paradoxus]
MKEDDSSLKPAELRAVEERARQSLDKAAAWGRFPTPVEDIVSAAKLRVASKGLFDPERLLAFAKQKTANALFAVKTALSKILGLYDANEQIIHIDESVGLSKQQFLKLHETGHHELPAHRKIFTFFQDCEKSLAPEIADQFEREANNFARYALFQGATFGKLAADMPLGIKSPINLAKKFGASNYASLREFARTNHRPCLVYVLEPIQFAPGRSASAVVRRIETSPSFEERFGRPTDQLIDSKHALFSLLPIGRKMIKPTTLIYGDKNGDKHECLGEAFDTTYNVLLLIYPVKALNATGIIVPAGHLSLF